MRKTEVVHEVDRHLEMDHPIGFGSKDYTDPVIIRVDLTQQHQKVT